MKYVCSECKKILEEAEVIMYADCRFAGMRSLCDGCLEKLLKPKKNRKEQYKEADDNEDEDEYDAADED